jgi:hypothetical protein
LTRQGIIPRDIIESLPRLRAVRSTIYKHDGELEEPDASNVDPRQFGNDLKSRHLANPLRAASGLDVLLMYTGRPEHRAPNKYFGYHELPKK